MRRTREQFDRVEHAEDKAELPEVVRDEGSCDWSHYWAGHAHVQEIMKMILIKIIPAYLSSAHLFPVLLAFVNVLVIDVYSFKFLVLFGHFLRFVLH